MSSRGALSPALYGERVPGTLFQKISCSAVLNTPIAVQVSVQVRWAFVRLREMLGTHEDLASKLEKIEKKYDAQFKVVFDAIRQLMAPSEKAPRSIGPLMAVGSQCRLIMQVGYG